MKTKLLLSPINLSATGVGPKIFRPMFPFLLAGIAVQIFLPAAFRVPLIKAETLAVAGGLLLIAGILFWICSLIQFLAGFQKGKLITAGAFSLSRNPIYVSWFLFILPGLAGILNNWIFLLAATVMYIVFLQKIPEEEQTLADAFGEIYTAYSQKVSRILSFTAFKIKA